MGHKSGMTSRLTRISGGVLAIFAALVVLLGATPARPVSAEVPNGTDLSVTREADGAYRVHGSFTVVAPRTVVWAVLTDYANLPSFVSSLRSSEVTTREADRITVAQHALGKVGPFSRSLHVTLHVFETEPRRIQFRDVSQLSFTSYAGTWEIGDTATGVRVTYDLQARPHTAPPLFGRSILGRNARDLLDQVRLEMLRRSVRAAAHRP